MASLLDLLVALIQASALLLYIQMGIVAFRNVEMVYWPPEWFLYARMDPRMFGLAALVVLAYVVVWPILLALRLLTSD